jgi:hypothetical protein
LAQNLSRQGIAIGNQASQLFASDVEAALAKLEEAGRLCREAGNIDGAATFLMNRGLLLAQELGRTTEGLALLEEAHQLASDHGLASLASEVSAPLEHFRRTAT